MRKAHRVLGRKTKERKRPLGRKRQRWEDGDVNKKV
jgi:hypothetical protein